MTTTFREQVLLLTQVPIYAVVIGIELIFSHLHHQKLYTFKETVQNIYLSFLNFCVDAACRLFYMYIFFLCFQYSVVSWGEKGIFYWVALVILQDFMFYWLHRNDHFIRFFWATHVTHHSAEHYNLSVGFRSSVLEPIYRFVYFIPLVFLGFAPTDVMFVFSATQLWGTLVHTSAIGKLGILEHLFVTPSHHRVHHASNAKYLDRNMGMFLIIWDKMFGTFQKELPAKDYEPIRYGLTTNLKNPNWFSLVFHEFIQIFRDLRQPRLSFRQKIGYLFGKPGYSHDGSRLTSDEMRDLENLDISELQPSIEKDANLELEERPSLMA